MLALGVLSMCIYSFSLDNSFGHFIDEKQDYQYYILAMGIACSTMLVLLEFVYDCIRKSQ
jgi:hypothetical protein